MGILVHVVSHDTVRPPHGEAGCSLHLGAKILLIDVAGYNLSRSPGSTNPPPSADRFGGSAINFELGGCH